MAKIIWTGTQRDGLRNLWDRVRMGENDIERDKSGKREKEGKKD